MTELMYPNHTSAGHHHPGTSASGRIISVQGPRSRTTRATAREGTLADPKTNLVLNEAKGRAKQATQSRWEVIMSDDDKVAGTANSPWPTTRPAPYDANHAPIITTAQKPGRWPGAEVPQIGGWSGGSAPDQGAATKRAGIAEAEASRRQGALEQKYK